MNAQRVGRSLSIPALLVTLLSILAIACPLAPVAAEAKEEPAPNDTAGPLLKVGDPAPALKVSRWLQGDEVPKFEPGRAYVIHFWAPWCANCVGYMPQLAEIQAQYQGKGLTVIGVSVVDPNNSQEQVTSFAKTRGPRLKYTLAFAGDRAMYDTWVAAAGVKTVTCTFIVDKTGRIADIGHSMYLPVALPKVVEGTATAKQVGDEMAKIHAEVEAWLEVVQRDPQAGLRAISEFEAKYPPLADYFLAATFKLGLLPKHGKPGEAVAYAEALIKRSHEKDDARMLRQASSILRIEGKESRELLALAVRAAREVVRIDGEENAWSLLDLADAYFVSGDKAHAEEWAAKAVHAARGESPAVKESVEREAKRFRPE